MKIGLILKIFFGVIVVAIIGAVAFVLTLDVNKYKPELAALVQQETGRKLDLKGAISLKILPRPALVVKDVTFANASWGSRPEMAKLGELAAEVEVIPLIKGGNLVITFISVKDLDLLLETDGRGSANWVMVPPGDAAAQKPTPDAKVTGAPQKGGVTIPALEKLRLENVHLVYRDGKTKQETKFDLRKLDALTGSADRLELKAEANFRDEDIVLEAKLGPVAALLQPKAPYPVDIDLAVAGSRLKAKGVVSDIATQPKLDLKIDADVPDLAKFNKLAAAELPGGKPIKLSTAVAGDPAKEIQLSGLAAEYGATKLTGGAKIGLAGSRPRIEAKLASPMIDIDELQPKQSGTAAKTAPGARPPAARNGQRRLFPDDPLPLEGLGAADADVELAIAQLKSGNMTLANLSTRVVLSDRQLDVKPLTLQAFDGAIEGTVGLNARGQTAALAIDLKGAKLDVGQLLKQTADKDVIETKADLNLSLRGAGRSVAQIMASLDGKTELILGPGRIKSKWADLAAADVLQQAMPWASKEESRLNCVVSRFDIARGVAVSRTLLADTERVTLTGDGQINLGTEQINMRLMPRPKEASLASLAKQINVTGWLGDPSIRPDTVAVAKGVVGAVGGAVTGVARLPLDVIAPSSGGASSTTEDRNPCVTALSGKAAAAPPPAAQAPPPSQQQPQQRQTTPSGNPLQNLGDGVKGLFGGTKR